MPLKQLHSSPVITLKPIKAKKRQGFFRRGVTKQGEFLGRLIRGKTTRAERRREKSRFLKGLGIAGAGSLAAVTGGFLPAAGVTTGGLVLAGATEKSPKLEKKIVAGVKGFDPAGAGEKIGEAFEKGTKPSVKKALKKGGVAAGVLAGVTGAAVVGKKIKEKVKSIPKGVIPAKPSKTKKMDKPIEMEKPKAPSIEPLAPVKKRARTPQAAKMPQINNIVAIQNVISS